jgi:hypothetical protein
MIRFDSGKRGRDVRIRAATRKDLVAAATAAAAASSAAGTGGGFGGAAGYGGAEDRKLDGGSFAGTFGAGDFLLAVDDDLFELGLAVVADVFVDGHSEIIPSPIRFDGNADALGEQPS